MPDLGYAVACNATVRFDSKVHERQHEPKKRVGETAKGEKKAKDKAGVKKNQRAVEKGKLGQNTNKRVSKTKTVIEEKPMKHSNLSNTVVSKVRGWALIIAVMVANSTSQVM